MALSPPPRPLPKRSAKSPGPFGPKNPALACDEPIEVTDSADVSGEKPGGSSTCAAESLALPLPSS